jgi:hypothetical protein
VIGDNFWKSETHGHRFFAEVLAKKPTTVQAAIDKAASLKEPFTASQVQGHVRWAYTMGGVLEIDGNRYEAPKPKVAKATKAAKVVAPAAARKSAPRRTQKLKRAA